MRVDARRARSEITGLERRLCLAHEAHLGTERIHVRLVAARELRRGGCRPSSRDGTARGGGLRASRLGPRFAMRRCVRRNDGRRVRQRVRRGRPAPDRCGLRQVPLRSHRAASAGGSVDACEEVVLRDTAKVLPASTTRNPRRSLPAFARRREAYAGLRRATARGGRARTHHARVRSGARIGDTREHRRAHAVTCAVGLGAYASRAVSMKGHGLEREIAHRSTP